MKEYKGIRRPKGPEPSDVERGACGPPGSSIFEGRVLLIQENHARRDIDSKGGAEKK